MTEQQKPNVNSSWNKRGWLFFVGLIGVGGVALIGYWSVNFITHKLEAISTKSETTLTATQQLEIKYNQLQSDFQNLQSVVQKFDLTRTKYWKPSVIEHLIQMADLTLNTTGDTKLALTFLLKAKQYAGDPELSAINHALNKDIASLQMVSNVDASGLILKLEALSQKVSLLPLVAPRLVTLPKEPTNQEAPTSVQTLWQRFFTSSLRALKDLVIIRHQELEPLLSPEQETILRLNLQTKLLEAELAVMQCQNSLYQSCLESIKNWLTRYFVVNQQASADLLSTLQELQQVDLKPKLVFPTESIAAVINFINANPLPSITEPPSQPRRTMPIEGEPTL